jgi:Spy/CpxP family protein refolding chaperone
MRRKLLITVLILSLGLNAGVFVSVFFHHMRAKCFKEGVQKESSWMKKHIKNKLGLSDDQAANLEKGREEMRLKTVDIRNLLSKKRGELFTMVKNTDTYTNEMDKLITEVSVLQADMERNIVKHAISTKKVLNPQQMEKFHKMMEKGFGKMHKNPGEGPMGGPGPDGAPGCGPKGGF